MAIQLINYDLNKEKNQEDRAQLLEKIRSTYPDHRCIADSCYAVCTSEDAETVWAVVRRFIDANDLLLVSRLTRDFQCWLPKQTVEWIEQRL